MTHSMHFSLIITKIYPPLLVGSIKLRRNSFQRRHTDAPQPSGWQSGKPEKSPFLGNMPRSHGLPDTHASHLRCDGDRGKFRTYSARAWGNRSFERELAFIFWRPVGANNMNVHIFGLHFFPTSKHVVSARGDFSLLNGRVWNWINLHNCHWCTDIWYF